MIPFAGCLADPGDAPSNANESEAFLPCHFTSPEAENATNISSTTLGKNGPVPSAVSFRSSNGCYCSVGWSTGEARGTDVSPGAGNVIFSLHKQLLKRENHEATEGSLNGAKKTRSHMQCLGTAGNRSGSTTALWRLHRRLSVQKPR